MSYEGYVVIYCVCGYRKDSRDAYQDPFDEKDKDPCPICGSKEELRDYVDQTNGCECDELLADWEGNLEIEDPPVCSAHEKVTKIVETVGEQICPCCNGKGNTPIYRYDVSMLRKKD